MTEDNGFWDRLQSTKVSYADGNLEYVCKRKPWFNIGFRSIGVLLVLASVSSPLLLLIDDPRFQKRGLAVIAFAIALFSGLNSLLQWQTLWQKFAGLQMFIEHAIAVWEIEIAQAKAKDDKSAARLATRNLVDGIGAAMSSENVRFFRQIQLPEAANTHVKPNG